MKQGVYRIADTVIQICSLHEQVHTLCRDYRSEEPAELVITVDRSHIDQERAMAEKQNRLEGISDCSYSDGYLETLAVYRKIAQALLSRGVLLFHGSAIAVDGEGYLFTAPSGTGKSTHTRLWRERFGERAFMVNDDKPLLKITDSGVSVYGTPWDGKHRLSRNTHVPLKAICILERNGDNHIEPITAADALMVLLQQTHRPRNRDDLILTLDVLNELVGRIRLYRLGCNMMPEAADVSYNGMQEPK